MNPRNTSRMNPSLEDLKSNPLAASKMEGIDCLQVVRNRHRPLRFLMLPALLLGMAPAYIAFGHAAAADGESTARNAEERNGKTQADLATHEKHLAEQAIRVYEAQERMQDIERKLKIIEIGSVKIESSINEHNTGDPAIIETSSEQIFNLEQEIEILRAQINALKGLEDEDLIGKAGVLYLADPKIQKYYSQLNDLLLAENRTQQTGFDEHHPQRIAIRTQLDSIKKLLTRVVEDAQGHLPIKLKLAESRLEVARKEIEGEENKKYVAYQLAREEYYTQLDILMALTRELVEFKKSMDDEATAPQTEEP